MAARLASLALVCLWVSQTCYAQPEIPEVTVEQPVLNGFDFEAELTFAWGPAGQRISRERYACLIDPALACFSAAHRSALRTPVFQASLQ